MSGFTTKDSGARITFDSGMRRDVQEGKPRYDLCDKPMYKRWAELMARGAEKYGADNWRKANSADELKRFKASAERHLQQWLAGDADEDHAAAVIFNLAGAEYVKEKLNGSPSIGRVVDVPEHITRSIQGLPVAHFPMKED